MFIYAEAELDYYHGNSKIKKYNPHIIYDSDFEVCLLYIDKYNLLESFVEEFILLYASREQNIAGNLACLIDWLRRGGTPHAKLTLDIIKEKYSQYLNNIERYIILL